jgi:hypothetical protein
MTERSLSVVVVNIKEKAARRRDETRVLEDKGTRKRSELGGEMESPDRGQAAHQQHNKAGNHGIRENESKTATGGHSSNIQATGQCHLLSL